MCVPADPAQSARKPRTDAVRNRERILAAAKEAFTRDGAEASLDNIARQAQVGSGTLYRHFPTRDSLIEGVYRVEAEKLAARADQLAGELPPLDALRTWMLLFVDYIAAKKIIAPALNSVTGGSDRLYMQSSGLILGAIAKLVNRAVVSGDLRPDADPWGLLMPLIGVSLVPLSPGWSENARKLVDVLLRGSMPSQ